MNLNNRVPVEFPQPRHLPVFRMEKARQPHPGDKDIRVLLVQFWRTYRAFRHFTVLGQRIITPFFQLSGPQFKLPGRRGKALFLILLVFHLTPYVIHFLEILPGDPQGFQDIVKAPFKGIPPVFALPYPVGQVVEHFVIGATFTHLNHLTPR
ncbi:hypothetical protein ES703_77500 [subsurface metagenome]